MNRLQDNLKVNFLSWRTLSEKRNILMGFATLWIVCLHGTELYSDVNIPIITFLFQRGNIGVEIFLIVSAVGLYYSMEKGTRIDDFYKKRIQRVVIPYLILSSWYWVWNTLAYGETISYFFRNWLLVSFITDGVATSWYVLLILCLYLIFPLIYRVEKSNEQLILVFIAADIIINISIWFLLPDAYDDIEIALTRVPSFLCGCYIAPKVKENKRIDKCAFMVESLGMILGALCIILCLKLGHKEYAIMAYRYTSLFVALLCCIVIASVLNSEYKVYRILAEVGGASLEIYLLHVFIRNILATYSIGSLQSMLAKTIIYLLSVSGVIIVSIVMRRPKINKRRGG